jgi:hypothetical protein
MVLVHPLIEACGSLTLDAHGRWQAPRGSQFLPGHPYTCYMLPYPRDDLISESQNLIRGQRRSGVGRTPHRHASGGISTDRNW